MDGRLHSRYICISGFLQFFLCPLFFLFFFFSFSVDLWRFSNSILLLDFLALRGTREKKGWSTGNYPLWSLRGGVLNLRLRETRPSTPTVQVSLED